MPADDVPLWLAGLKNANPATRLSAVRQFAKSPAAAHKAFARLLLALDDSEQSVREGAVQALAGIGPQAARTLMKLLKHEDKYVRRQAVWSLGKWGPDAKPALGSLCDALTDSDPRVASGAAQAIGAMGDAGANAIPALDTAMRGTNVVQCRLAAKALSQIGPAALPALLKAVGDHDPFVRGEAAIAIGWMGPAANGAVGALVETINRHRVRTIPRFVNTAGFDPSTLATPIALPAPPEPVSGVETARLAAIQALGRIGAAADLAIPTLEAVVSEEAEPFSGAAVTALREIRGE